MLRNHLINKLGGGARGVGIARSLILILVVLIFEISPANAQVIPPLPTYDPYDPTTTPYPTKTPFYGPTINPPGIDPTPTPAYLGDCPLVPPDPDRELSFYYLKNCYMCIEDRSVIPTLEGGIQVFDLDPIGTLITPEVTDMITLTPTEVFNESAEVLFEWPNIYESEYIPQNFMHLTNVLDITYSQLMNVVYYMRESSIEEPYLNTRLFGEYYGVFYLEGRGSAYNSYNSGVRVTGECRGIDGCLLKFQNNEYLLTYGQVYKFWEGIVNVGTGGNLVTDEINFEVIVYKDSITTGKQGFTLRVQKLSAYMFTNSDWFNDFIWSYDGREVDPPDIGYCSEWKYQDEEEIGPPLITLPNIDIWQGQCINIIPAFSWFRDSSGSFLFDINLNFPGFNICPVWVSLSSLSIAGIDIPFEIMFLPALVWLLDLIIKL